MDNHDLQLLVEKIYSLHEAELDCESCDEQLDCIAELAAVGYEPSLLLPAVQKHLDCCSSCRETFRALLCILKGEQAGEL